MPLYNNWNLIGYQGNGSMDIPLVLNNISGKWNIVWGWKNTAWKAKKDADINMDLPVPELTRLNPGEAYWIKIKEGQSAEWRFDITPPEIMSVSPIRNASNVPTDSVIIFTFTEDMDPSTINSETFTISTAGVNINGTVTYNGRTAIFKPAYPLSYFSVYAATIKKSVHDKAGNEMTSDYVNTFTTIPFPDSIIKNYKIGDLITYAMIYKTTNYGEFKGDIAYQLVSDITNPYGVSCKVFNINGALTGSSFTVPVSEKSIFYQDAQGNLFDCGKYDSDTASYIFITNTNDTPDGLKLSIRNPVVIGDVFSGIINYQDGSWEQCTRKVEAKESTTTVNGIFNAFKITDSCSYSEGYTSTTTSWFYPPIFFIKQDSTDSRGYQGLLDLKSYSFVE